MFWVWVKFNVKLSSPAVQGWIKSVYTEILNAALFQKLDLGPHRRILGYIATSPHLWLLPDRAHQQNPRKI